MQNDLTKGSIWKTLIRFSCPYLISCFLQTFYGLADLFVTGQFNGAAVINAVSVGSQITHMLTVIVIGLAMGSTVCISNAIGAKDGKTASKCIGNTVILFILFSLILTVLLLFFTDGILNLISMPDESLAQGKSYIQICFMGLPFITAYNVISSIFRGLGDSKSPLYFIAAAGVINILLDFLFIGPLEMQAAGAALATVLSQALSVLFALIALHKGSWGLSLSKDDFRFQSIVMSRILRIGIPVALQDGLIQISFLIITTIANSRGVDMAAAVGIVEKVISFLFLVPSAMLSTVSVVAAQCAGAGQHRRGREALFCGMGICLVFGVAVSIVCQFAAEGIVWLFAKQEANVIALGSQYLHSYVWDCAFAGIHFCFSGYFCAYGKSGYSFLSNMLSAVLVRIPGAYLTSLYFPDTLFPMGLAAPTGSLLSSLVSVALYAWMRKNNSALDK